MIDKIKNFKKTLFGVSICYSIIVTFLMLLNLFNSTITVELFDSDDNKLKIQKYKNDVMLLRHDNCTDVISKMIDYYENTSYNGEINLKEMYDFSYETSFLSFYMEVKESCNLSDITMEEYNFPAKFLTASIQQDELFEHYYFQYELGIKDVFTRILMEPSMTSVEYKIRKNFELEIIEDLIEIIGKGDVENE